jgi:hypothetical protein
MTAIDALQLLAVSLAAGAVWYAAAWFVIGPLANWRKRRAQERLAVRLAELETRLAADREGDR